MRVLSLFDGMSCGQIALRELGVTPEVYYASEVNKEAIAQTQLNFPATVQLGDVRKVDVNKLGRIDLLIGGSPCQDFSSAGIRRGMSDGVENVLTLNDYLVKKRAGMKFVGQSYLFWEYARILRELRAHNPNLLFLLENVKMKKQWQRVIDRELHVPPVLIDSGRVSAQTRARLFWTNIRGGRIPQPRDRGLVLADIIEEDVKPNMNVTPSFVRILKPGSRALVMPPYDRKVKALLRTPSNYSSHIYQDGRIRRLTAREYIKAQTIPEWYKWECSDASIKELCGNGWTVEVIKHIFKFLDVKG